LETCVTASCESYAAAAAAAAAWYTKDLEKLRLNKHGRRKSTFLPSAFPGPSHRNGISLHVPRAIHASPTSAFFWAIDASRGADRGLAIFVAVKYALNMRG